MTDPTSTPAGWYPDVTDPAGIRQRWWDGAQWTDHYHVPVPTSPQPSAQPQLAAPSETVPSTPGQPAPWTPAVGGPSAPLAASRVAGRPWYRRKAIIIPVAAVAGIVLISGVANAVNGGRRSTVTAATEESRPSTEPTQTARATSTPTPTFDIPDVSGETIAEARADVEAAGFTLQYDAAWGDDWVVQTQTPAAGRASVDPVSVSITAVAPEPVLTRGQENAVESAQSYLRFTGFSRAGLFEQLTSQYGEGYTPEDAEFALAYIEQRALVDWNAEAVESAQSYLSFTSFSRDGLYEQLTSEYGEQFTPDQANYALAAVGY